MKFNIERKNNLNADTLSRPVLDCNYIEINNDNEKTNLDVMDDDALLSYLRTGKYPNGASHKQIKRINKDSLYYKCDEKGIWYRNNTQNQQYVLVPEKSEREKLIY